jgi:predicted component of type VI protein secretion system
MRVAIAVAIYLGEYRVEQQNWQGCVLLPEKLGVGADCQKHSDVRRLVYKERAIVSCDADASDSRIFSMKRVISKQRMTGSLLEKQQARAASLPDSRL